jgi:cell shape-determining protein MreC
LATALQSEKATVSRAVAQNRELKEQLQELQERFVTVSQQAADEQNRAETLAHANAQLATVVAQVIEGIGAISYARDDSMKGM